ncbi:hypothetical protein B0H19DRAFT_1227885 [Mycena capillaripes]|nr:hypothetical protein B0H19DRAFT_1227885 [Mycena capillaripes]
MSDTVPQLPSSILLGSLSLIPNDRLRYTALGLVVGVGLIYVIQLKRLSVQLSQLEDMIKQTEETIRDAKKYRLLSRDIADCAKGVKKIRTAVQLIVEAERQRQLTEDINAKETILAGFRCPSTFRAQIQSDARPITITIIKNPTR